MHTAVMPGGERRLIYLVPVKGYLASFSSMTGAAVLVLLTLVAAVTLLMVTALVTTAVRTAIGAGRLGAADCAVLHYMHCAVCSAALHCAIYIFTDMHTYT